MVKATGKEIKEFWIEPVKGTFLEDYFHEIDQEDIEIIGTESIEEIEDTKKYDTKNLGYFCHDSDDNKPVINFTTAFQRWRKEQTTSIILVEVPKDKLEEAIAQIKALGYKVG